MRVRVPLIIEEEVMKKIDEIAGEKHRRAATIETALREFIARHERKAKSAPASKSEEPAGVSKAKRTATVDR